ncbi:hypothetical protein ACFXG1_15175 [Streptomyces sp. NPDC059248]|uniref:hypothetical protein n=1 Tax=Streptomyces sp. NPDC059248 TaxID=3346791 RepID=UPI0036B599ED
MTPHTALAALPVPPDVRDRVLSAAQLRRYGVTGARLAAHCRAGGPWQALLPGVYLLRRGVPTGEELLRGVLLYAGRPPGRERDAVARPYGDAVLTGAAALALHGFASVGPPGGLGVVDVLVPGTRRLRSTGRARIVRTSALPEPVAVDGLPVAPVARAVADAVEGVTDPGAVRLLVAEAVGGGHCDPAALVAELERAGLLRRPRVLDAVEALLAEGRSRAEDRLYGLVYASGLPDPLWNVDLRLPGGPGLGRVDAYWPDHCVAVVLDASPASPTDTAVGAGDTGWAARVRQREHLERLGITVVPLTPRKVRDWPEQQAVVVRTALSAAVDREPPAYVVVLPR